MNTACVLIIATCFVLSAYSTDCPKGDDGAECCGNGWCDNGSCKCNPGFTGYRCDAKASAAPHTPRTPHAPRKACPKDGQGRECCGNGHCENGNCKCNSGFSGATCESKSAPAPKSCPKDGQGRECCGNGWCNNGNCQCNSGFTGSKCENKNAPPPPKSCPSDASGKQCCGNGWCNNGNCQCNSGWSGNDCGQRTSSYAEEDFVDQVDEEFIAQLDAEFVDNAEAEFVDQSDADFVEQFDADFVADEFAAHAEDDEVFENIVGGEEFLATDPGASTASTSSSVSTPAYVWAILGISVFIAVAAIVIGVLVMAKRN